MEQMEAVIRGFVAWHVKSFSREDFVRIRQECSNEFDRPLPEQAARILADMVLALDCAMPEVERQAASEAVEN